MQLFYSQYIAPDKILLTGDEAWHCSKVLRMTPGSSINITDGKGNLYHCELVESNPKESAAKIISVEKEIHRDWNLQIAISPTKNIDRFEWFAEKATEIGIDSITPLYTSHSERTRLKPERIGKIILSAMKQSLKYTVPELNPETRFKDLIKQKFEGQKFIAYCETGLEDQLTAQYKKGSDVIILIGPEGDFSPDEVKNAVAEGFIPVSLGRSRLRTETAGIVACQIIHTLNSI